MRHIVSFVIVVVLIATVAPAWSSEKVLMVDINYFAAERHQRGILVAQKAISDGNIRLYIAPFAGPLSRLTKAEQRRGVKRSILMDKIMQQRGIEPVHEYPSECTGDPGQFAYVRAYNLTMDAALREKFGPDYWQSIEAEADRRLALKLNK